MMHFFSLFFSGLDFIDRLWRFHLLRGVPYILLNYNT